jgi:putative membrane protein
MPTFKRFLLLWVSATLALWIVDAAFDSLHFDSPQSMILRGLIQALVKVTLKPLLLLVTLPITIVSFGLALPVLNGLVLLGIAALVPGFEISGFWMGVLCALAVSVVSMLINVATGQTGVRGQMHRGVRVEIHQPASGRPGEPQDKTTIDVETREKP